MEKVKGFTFKRKDSPFVQRQRRGSVVDMNYNPTVITAASVENNLKNSDQT